MSNFIGKYVKIVDLYKYPCPSNLEVKEGDVLKIIDAFIRSDTKGDGATIVEHKGIQYDIKNSNGYHWAYITKSMVGKNGSVWNKDWGLRWATEEEYKATLPYPKIRELKANISPISVGTQKFIIHPYGTPKDIADAVSESLFSKEVKAAYTPSDESLFGMDLGVGKDCTPSEPILFSTDDLVIKKFEHYKGKMGLDTKSLEDRYNDWVIENIHVYELFKKFTLQAIAAGKKKISHWLIVNRMRWEMEIETKALTADERKYKISNDYIAFLARDFVKDHPEHAEIFNLKLMKRV